MSLPGRAPGAWNGREAVELSKGAWVGTRGPALQADAVELLQQSRPTTVLLAELGDKCVDLLLPVDPCREQTHLLEAAGGTLVVRGPGLLELCDTTLIADKPRPPSDCHSSGVAALGVSRRQTRTRWKAGPSGGTGLRGVQL